MRDPSILSILSLFQQTGYLGDSALKLNLNVGEDL